MAKSDNTAADAPLWLTEFSVNQLFGQYDYRFELKPDGLTLLHGPNGADKSTACEADLSRADCFLFQS